jgi:hypothetical protein
MFRDKASRRAGISETANMVSAADTIDEASLKLREVARPMWSDTRASSLGRVARSLGISRSQARRIVYREVKQIPAHVLENIRIAYARLEAKAERMVEDELRIQIALRRELDGDDGAFLDGNRVVRAQETQPSGASGPCMEAASRKSEGQT